MASKKQSAKKRAAAEKPASPPASAPPPKRAGTATAFAAVVLALAAAHIAGPDTIRDLLYDTFPAVFKPVGAPEGGYFPAGCRWRDAPLPLDAVGQTVAPAFWGIREYEFWDEKAGNWTRDRPEACVLHPLDAAAVKWRWGNESRTGVDCNRLRCVIDNLWTAQGRFYYLTDDADGTDMVHVTRDVSLSPLNVVSAAAWPPTIAAGVVPGLTLFIDFVYFIHPTAIGHWLEHLLPTVSVLREESARPDRIVILHLKRTHVGEWVRAALAATLNIPPGSALPPIYFQEETGSMFLQIGQGFEDVGAGQWTAFERAFFVKDHNSRGKRVALTPEDASAFTNRAYRLHGLRPPRRRRSGAALPPPPRTITLFRKSSNRRIINEDELVSMLQEFGAPVTVLEFTDVTPMAEQLTAMANTGLLVSAHTSALANAAFLPPGAAILELIHLNWVWLDKSFKVQSDARGDLHHWAWRATAPEHARYIHPRDEQRFGGQEWAGDNCDTEECTEAHTNLDVVVDVEAVRELLRGRLPAVWAGTAVDDAELPWPPIPSPSGQTLEFDPEYEGV